MKERFIRVVKYISIILIIGLSYAGICSYTGFGIPCIFREVTGYQCAGCGITHMFLAMLKLDFKTAFQENQLVFIMLPIISIVAIFHICQYVKSGKTEIKKFENVLCYIFIVVLVVWGIVRNFGA